MLLRRKEQANSNKPDGNIGEKVTRHDTNDVCILILWVITSVSLYPTNKYCAWFVIGINCILLWFLVAYNYGWINLIVKDTYTIHNISYGINI